MGRNLLGSTIGMCTWTDTSIAGTSSILVSALPETSQDVTYLEKVTKIRLNQINNHVSLIFQAHEKIKKYFGLQIKLTFGQKIKNTFAALASFLLKYQPRKLVQGDIR